MPLSSTAKPTAMVFATTFVCSLLLGTALPTAEAHAGHKYYGQYNSGNYHKHKNYRGNKYQYRKYKWKRNYRHNYYSNGGDIFAAGIIGLAIGAIISDSSRIRRQRVDSLYYQLPTYAPPRAVNTYENPYYTNYNGRPYYGTEYENPPAPLPLQNPAQDGPKVITYDEAMADTALAEPWSPQWYSYCRAKFGSFNETSGTYLGYDGKRHFCVAK